MAEKRTNTSRRSAAAKTASKVRPGKRQQAVKRKQVVSKAVSKAASKPAARKSVARKPIARKPAASRQATRNVAAKKVIRPAAKPVKLEVGAKDIVNVVEGALDEMKAVQIKVLDVRKLTDIADTLVIASGNSDRHVRSIAERVVEHAKKAGFRPMGVEGQRDGEWVLVDLQDVIVHIMLPRVRELYRLENLWDVSAARRDAAVG